MAGCVVTGRWEYIAQGQHQQASHQGQHAEHGQRQGHFPARLVIGLGMGFTEKHDENESKAVDSR